jgi:hypothetical protein
MSMAHCDIKPFLPRTGSEGDEVCDRHGNRWRFDAEGNSWISSGVIAEAPLVTEQANGLVTSDIFAILRKLQTYTSQDPDQRTLKLLPGRDAYWYYFRSSDKLFRFTKEGEDCLRIEIDKGRFFQILMKEICPGAKGPKGEKGDKGIAGKPGQPEICFSPSDITNDRLDFAIFTPTPLLAGGPISLPGNVVPNISVRLFAAELPVGVSTIQKPQLHNLAIYYSGNDPRDEIMPKFQATRELLQKRDLGMVPQDGLCGIPLSEVAVYPNNTVIASTPSITIEINPSDPTQITIDTNIAVAVDQVRTANSIQFDLETNIVCGSIFLEPGSQWADLDVDGWCIKSRQKGPNGLKGEPGECRVKIVECIIDDTNIRATCPIINTRLDCDRDIIYTLCSDLLTEICVDKVSLLPDSAILANTNTIKSVFAAAEMTLEECKRINRYEVDLELDEIPELDLLHWDPQPGCVTTRHYDRHKFNWIPDTDIPACDSTAAWFGPEGARPGLYPYDVHTRAEAPENDCCQDDFFYCEAVQEAPCGREPPPR